MAVRFAISPNYHSSGIQIRGSIPTDRNLTVAAWVNVGAWSASYNFPSLLSIYKTSGGNVNYLNFGFDDGFGATKNYSFLRRYSGTAEATVRAANNSVDTTDKWQFICGVDGGAGVPLQLYVGDETTVAAEPSTYPLQDTPSGTPDTSSLAEAWVGNRIRLDSGFPGAVAFVGVYDGALTAEQIREIQVDPATAMRGQARALLFPGLTNISEVVDTGPQGFHGRTTLGSATVSFEAPTKFIEPGRVLHRPLMLELAPKASTITTSNVPVTTVSVTAPVPTTTTTIVSSVPTATVSVSAPVPTTTTEIVSAVPATSVSVTAPAPTATEISAVPATSVTVTAPTPTTATTTVSSVPTTTVSVTAPTPTTATTVVSLVPETSVTVTAPVPTTSQSGVIASDVPVAAVTVTAPVPTTNVVALDTGRTGGAWLPVIYVDENGDPVDKKEIKRAVKKVKRQAKKAAPKAAQEVRQQATVAIEALDQAVPARTPLDELLEAARRIDDRTERLITIFVQAQERNRQDEAALLLLLAA